MLAERRRMRYAIRFTNVDVLAGVVRGRIWRQYVPLVLFLLALAALCVGVARPQRTTLVPKDRATVILVVDVSRSMEAKDVKPSRIGAATQRCGCSSTRCPTAAGGLIAFAGDPAVAAPPTTDHEPRARGARHASVVSELRRDGDRRRARRGGRFGQEAVGGGNGNLASVTTRAPIRTHGLVSILFLSDGAQTRGQLLPLEGADRAARRRHPVYTVALGTPNGTLQFGGGGGGPPRPPQGFPNGFGFGRNVPVPPDPATLHAIANRTGGQFFAARDAESLKSAYSKLGSRLGRKPGKTEVTYGFLALATGLLVAAGLLSAAWSPRLP
jgi:Ca-activated chloride channel family protein